MSMNSKQRVKAAFARTEPDRVPIHYMSNPGLDARLKAHFGLDPTDAEGLRRALGVDFRTVNPTYTGPRLHPQRDDCDVDPVWGFHTRWIEHPSGGYQEIVHWPLMEADDATIANWAVPDPDDHDYTGLAERARKFDEWFVCLGGAGVGDIINGTSRLRGMEQVLVDLMTDEPATMAYIDRRIDSLAGTIERALDAAGRWIDLVWIGEDLGTQIGPMISLDLFRRQIRPRLQRFVDLASAHDVPVMIHSCGSSSWAFDDFVDMGIRVVDTLQPEARDMAPGYLKGRYGDRLAFHGCISTAGPVAKGTVEDTVADCRSILETMKPGGGYAFAPTHCLQDDSPTENVLAMYETARQDGRY